VALSLTIVASPWTTRSSVSLVVVMTHRGSAAMFRAFLDRSLAQKCTTSSTTTAGTERRAGFRPGSPSRASTYPLVPHPIVPESTTSASHPRSATARDWSTASRTPGARRSVGCRQCPPPSVRSRVKTIRRNGSAELTADRYRAASTGGAVRWRAGSRRGWRPPAGGTAGAHDPEGSTPRSGAESFAITRGGIGSFAISSQPQTPQGSRRSSAAGEAVAADRAVPHSGLAYSTSAGTRRRTGPGRCRYAAAMPYSRRGA